MGPKAWLAPVPLSRDHVLVDMDAPEGQGEAHLAAGLVGSQAAGVLQKAARLGFIKSFSFGCYKIQFSLYFLKTLK